MRFVIFLGAGAIAFGLQTKLFEYLSKPGVKASTGRSSRLRSRNRLLN
jgi:hypothetical protein